MPVGEGEGPQASANTPKPGNMTEPSRPDHVKAIDTLGANARTDPMSGYTPNGCLLLMFFAVLCLVTYISDCLH